SGVSFLVDVWMFQPSDRKEAIEKAMHLRVGDSLFRSGTSAFLEKGSQLTVKLAVPPWKVQPEVRALVWMGKLTSVSFRVNPDAAMRNENIVGDCRIFLNGIRIGQVFFELSLASKASGTQFHPCKLINNAFASYAAKDRRAVLARVQGLEKVGVRVF